MKSVSHRFDVEKRGSRSVLVLESAWKLIRAADRNIPPAVITLVDSRSRTQLRGYFAQSTWRKRRGTAHEIGISPSLIGQPVELLGTMLHEAAHAALFEAGKNGGIGSTVYYHTKEFRDKCISFGLECAFINTRYGWALTRLPKHRVPPQFAIVAEFLRRKLPAGTTEKVTGGWKRRKLPVSGHTMLVCGCEHGRRSIYVNKSVLQEGGVVCRFCSEPFRQAT